MPLQHLFFGLDKILSIIKKSLLVILTIFVFFTLFGLFRNIDSKSRSNILTPAEISEIRRVKMYTDLDIKKDHLFGEGEVEGRRLQRWLLCKTVGDLCTPNLQDAARYREDSLSNKLAGIISLPLRSPPSSFIYLARDTLENAGFVPKTYAAGIGFYALSSFQPIWKAFRDLAYLVIVLVILVVGFMVMFGVGGGGKTSVNLETALPRLVIALLAIAFSYAIAGLFIDIMYISIILVVNLLGSQAGLSPPDQVRLAGQIISGSPNNLFWQMIGKNGQSDTNYWYLATSIYNIVPGYMQNVMDGIASTLFGTIFGSILTAKIPKIGMNDITSHPGSWLGSWGQIAKGITGTTAFVQKTLEKALGSGGGIMGVSTISLLINIVVSLIVTTFLGPMITKVVISLILILSMIVVTIRIFFALIWIYVDILLSLMFAPILLMFEAIPGQNAFLNWMKSLAVNLSVFPFIIAMMLIVRIIMNNGDSAAMWTPPFVAQISDQISLQIVIGGILLYSIPQLIKTYRQKLGGSSMLGSLGIGLGSMFVGVAPVLTGTSSILGVSGITGGMAKTLTAPLRQALGISGSKTADAVRIVADDTKPK